MAHSGSVAAPLNDDDDIERRLAAALGDANQHAAPAASSRAAQGWLDGYGITAPDVARYVDMLHGEPTAVEQAMRAVAAREGCDLLDDASVRAIAMHVRALHPRRVLELGTGVGIVTVHLDRVVPADGIIVSLEANPVLQGFAHEFLTHDEHLGGGAAIELRLGDPAALVHADDTGEAWDVIVLGGAHPATVDLLDAAVARLARGGSLIIPRALRDGRVADSARIWDEDDPIVAAQRALNRHVASDVRFVDVALLTVGDGVLVAQRR